MCCGATWTTILRVVSEGEPRRLELLADERVHDTVLLRTEVVPPVADAALPHERRDVQVEHLQHAVVGRWLRRHLLEISRPEEERSH